MLIARAPVRVSFAGGGTDLPEYYEAHGGLVVSSTIDKYFYVFVNLNGSSSAQITSSDYHTFFRQQQGQPILWDGALSLPRAFLHEFGIDAGISIFLASEIPPGTGLGSSSAVAVAVGKALSTLCGLELSRTNLAELASEIEIHKLGMPIGRQDQYASAFGGLNVMRFTQDGVFVQPLRMPLPARRSLERRTMLFFTGVARDASTILQGQQAATRRRDAEVVDSLHRIKAMAESTIELLESGDLDGFGALLHESWQAKKRLADGVTNSTIDECYELALRHGALGGKIAGAGGGGFLMLYCEEPHQDAVTAALEARGLVRMHAAFEDGGAVVLLDAIPRVRPLGKGPRELAARPWMGHAFAS